MDQRAISRGSATFAYDHDYTNEFMFMHARAFHGGAMDEPPLSHEVDLKRSDGLQASYQRMIIALISRLEGDVWCLADTGLLGGFIFGMVYVALFLVLLLSYYAGLSLGVRALYTEQCQSHWRGGEVAVIS
jgi:hypothetical protein